MQIEIRPKAYSYIRMSSERQLSGDSLRRQLQNSRDYAAEHGLDLDETLRDIGVSPQSALRRGISCINVIKTPSCVVSLLLMHRLLWLKPIE